MSDEHNTPDRLEAALKEIASTHPVAVIAVEQHWRSLRQRAEQAERERDEARKDVEALKTVLTAERVGYQQVLDERDRAEADNLALLDVIRQMKDDDAWGSEHPGAALLERMRALEAFHDACFAYFVHAAATHDDGCPEDDTCECPHVIRVNEAFNDLKGMS